jgi:hypothetical protein
MKKSLTTTKDQKNMSASTLEKKYTPTTDTAKGSYSVIWSRGGRDYVGRVGRVNRFEIVESKYGFSLYDTSRAAGQQFVDNYQYFTDATEQSVWILVDEDAEQVRESNRTAAIAALVNLGLTSRPSSLFSAN